MDDEDNVCEKSCKLKRSVAAKAELKSVSNLMSREIAENAKFLTQNSALGVIRGHLYVTSNFRQTNKRQAFTNDRSDVERISHSRMSLFNEPVQHWGFQEGQKI